MFHTCSSFQLLFCNVHLKIIPSLSAVVAGVIIGSGYPQTVTWSCCDKRCGYGVTKGGSPAPYRPITMLSTSCIFCREQGVLSFYKALLPTLDLVRISCRNPSLDR
jgi:hypothetical protein